VRGPRSRWGKEELSKGEEIYVAKYFALKEDWAIPGASKRGANGTKGVFVSPQETIQRGSYGEPIGGGVGRSLVAAARFWEPRRVIYNLVLAAILVAWFVLSWPHFRPALTPFHLFQFGVLGLLANVCYSAAYLVDVPLLQTGGGTGWTKGRWGLWTAGMLFAILLENYWIADEIYPYVK
jgi:hypothetical protein